MKLELEGQSQQTLYVEHVGSEAERQRHAGFGLA
jgi:hypothetical protein